MVEYIRYSLEMKRIVCLKKKDEITEEDLKKYLLDYI